MDKEEKVKCTYYLERGTLDMIGMLEERRRRSRMRTKSQCSRSRIVGDAVRMLYEYECCGISKIHPDDDTGRW